ncbi:Na-Ca exchanger/integrin-beta4 (plasmid) [Calothrix parasitica NIES-267]|uniref:Na-Ca exchanger/integrin-beta4 n=1 Tax=Calothrix parasitica NIES-267 TaxID=1973488 RepID=A0A1Z4M314_9CYAN|nr:Na-Ca exchanger/integrin-beta4 [Calothrix parasitica NIES-267]
MNEAVSNKEQAGQDAMLGGQGADLFILGVNDWDTSFYDDGDVTQPGTLHYAVIEDFNKDEDRIQLKGLPEDYILDTSPITERAGTGIFYKRSSEQTNELIGIISNFTPDNLNLEEKYFVYTNPKEELPPSNTISFKESNFQIKEDDDSTEPIILVRGNDANKADVRLTLTDGSATSGDYEGNSIDISFAPGKLEKTVRIPINNDSDKEEDETINLSLESLSEEFVIGEQSKAILTIEDDDREEEKGSEDLHTIYEFIAKDIAYKDYNAGDKIDDYGYKVDKVFDDENTGFFALGLTSTIGKSPLLAIRGTEPINDYLKDIFVDINPKGVGFNQFTSNVETVTGWLNNQENPDITGHSLGGALSQYFASDFTSKGGRLNEIVTFNSPGISTEYTDIFNSDNAETVNHYITSGDIASLAGEEFIDGKYTVASFSDTNLLNKHLLPFLSKAVGYDKPEKSSVRPNDVTYKTFPSVNFLNSNFFTYTDKDYWAWILGGVAATQLLKPLKQFKTIPPLLIFRNTVESSRKAIGNGIEIISEAITGERIDSEDFVTIPKTKFNLLGLLTIQAEDLSVEYESQPEDTFKLQGKVSLPQLFNATGNFSNENYIQITQNGIDVLGELSIEDAIIIPKVWGIKEAKLSFDTINNKIEGQGAILIPSGLIIGGSLGFVRNELDSISLDVAGLNKPIGTTGLFLQGIFGQVNNIAESNLNPIDFGGGMLITAGAKINLPLPNWLGENISGSLIELNLDGSLNQDRIDANGGIDILYGLVKGTGGAELNWNEGFLSSDFDFNIANKFIEGKASFHTDFNLNIHMSGEATIKAPKISVDTGFFGRKINIGDFSLASGQFVLQFTNDDNFANDYIRGSGEIDLPFGIGKHEASIQVYLDGKVEASVGNFLIKTSSYTIAPETEWIILNANWDNSSSDAAVNITKPDGTIINESEFADNNIAIVDEMTTETTRAVIVKEPEAGIWDINLVDTTGLGTFEYTAFSDSEKPVVEITSLEPNEAGSEVTINYKGFDPDSQKAIFTPNFNDSFDPDSKAKISLFYDNDNEGNDGIIIETDIPENDGNASYTWNTQGIAPGDYYVYAMIVDSNNAPVFNYSQDIVTITESADLVVTKSTSSEPVKIGDSFKYIIQVTNNGSVESQGVKLSETLPPEINLTSTTPNFVSQSQNQLDFDLGNIAAGATETIEITVSAPLSPQLLRSRTQVESQTFDPDKNNNVEITDTKVVTELPQTTSEASFSDNQIFDFGGNFGETKQLKFSLASQNSKSPSEIGVFAVDDSQGSINGIAPSNPAYLTTALENSRTIFSLLPNNILEGVDFTRQLNFDASQRLGFYLIQDNTADTVLADLNNGVEPGNVSFAISTANESNFAPLQVSELEEESFQLAWKDAPNDNKENFLNLVLNMEVSSETSTSPGTGLQDNTELIDLRNTSVQATFSVASEAKYDNVVGWYRIDDESGSIGELKPGDAGYAQKAIGERSVVHFNHNGTQQPLQMEGLLAPYIIVDSTRELFLQNNPNLFGKQERAYFAFMEANPDKADHIRLLGDNTFGFEDLFNGGDKDYNDMILKVDLV